MIEEKVVEKTGEIVLGAAIDKLNAYKIKRNGANFLLMQENVFCNR